MKNDVRLIDANALKEIQIYALVDDKSIDNGISFAPITCVLKEEIDNAPTADMDERDADAFESGYIEGLNADKPKGEWVRTALYGQTCYECDNCHLHFDITTNFCPYCGAKMQKEEV